MNKGIKEEKEKWVQGMGKGEKGGKRSEKEEKLQKKQHCN